MILFLLIMIVLVSSIFRPRYYWFRPMPFRPFPFYRRRHFMRGPRPMQRPMGHGPRMF